jgi:hypothetical protein
MTQQQQQQLYQIYGDIRIRTLDQTVTDIAAILACPADVYAVVLPLGLLAALRQETEKEIIQPVSGRIPTGGTHINPASGSEEQEYAFEHLYWQRILRLELETEILDVKSGTCKPEKRSFK